MKPILFISALLLGIFVAHAQSVGQKSLYERLGGREGIQAVLDNVVQMVVSDPRVRLNSSARKTLDALNQQDTSTRLYQLLCEKADGPCKAGTARPSLEKTLRSMELTPSDWDAVVADFSAAMVKFKVSSREQAELRALIDRIRPIALSN